MQVLGEKAWADGILPRSDLSVSMPKGAAMPRTEPSKEALEAAKCCLGKDRPETPLTYLIATALDAFAAAAVERDRKDWHEFVGDDGARNAALEEAISIIETQLIDDPDLAFELGERIRALKTETPNG